MIEVLILIAGLWLGLAVVVGLWLLWVALTEDDWQDGEVLILDTPRSGSGRASADLAGSGARSGRREPGIAYGSQGVEGPRLSPQQQPAPPAERET